MKNVSISLAGGSLKGIWAHCGFLKYIEELQKEEKIKVTEVVGTSAGAIVGGLWCGGYNTGQIFEILRTLKPSDYLGWGKFWWVKSLWYSMPGGRPFRGLIKGKVFEKFLRKFVGGKDIKNCKPQLTLVTSNVSIGAGYYAKHGDLVDYMRASASIPYTFFPKEIDGYIYIDGGVVSNNPLEYLVENKNNDNKDPIITHSFYRRRMKVDNSFMQLKGFKFHKKLFEKILELGYWSQYYSARALAREKKIQVVDVSPSIPTNVSLLKPDVEEGVKTFKWAYANVKEQLDYVKL